MKDTWELAHLIVGKLNEAGAELGNASIYIVKDVLDKQQAAEQGLHLTGGILPPSEPLSPLKPGTGIEYLSHQPTNK